jgi:hypothetical protein
VNDAALAVEIADVLRGYADLVQIDSRALRQVSVAGRQEADAGTPLLKLCPRSFVDGHVETEVAQEKGGSEPTQ